MNSYEKDKYILEKNYNRNIKKIVNFVGQVIYNFETEDAENIPSEFISLKENTQNKKGFGIIEMDGCFIHLRGNKGEQDRCEVKVALVSSSDELIHYKNSKGEEQIKIEKREYTCFFGKI